MKLKSFITLGLTVTAIAVPTAIAADPNSYIGHPGGPGGVGLVPALSSSGSYIGHPGGPAGVGLVPAALNSSGSFLGHPGGPGGVGLVRATPSSSGSYLGHPGGPGGVGLVSTAASPSATGGFDWADAAIGGGFVAGLGILGAGAALMVRRRGVLAEQR